MEEDLKLKIRSALQSLNYSQDSVKSIMTGRMHPSYSQLKRLYREHGIDPRDMFKLTDKCTKNTQ